MTSTLLKRMEHPSASENKVIEIVIYFYEAILLFAKHNYQSSIRIHN